MHRGSPAHGLRMGLEMGCTFSLRLTVQAKHPNALLCFYYKFTQRTGKRSNVVFQALPLMKGIAWLHQQPREGQGKGKANTKATEANTAAPPQRDVKADMGTSAAVPRGTRPYHNSTAQTQTYKCLSRCFCSHIHLHLQTGHSVHYMAVVCPWLAE